MMRTLGRFTIPVGLAIGGHNSRLQRGCRDDFGARRPVRGQGKLCGCHRTPNGFSPEGISFGAGSTFYTGSLATGAIYRGDARTGVGGVFIPPQTDAVILSDAVFVTDNSRPVIYCILLGPGGSLPPASAIQTLPLTGDFQFVDGGVNGNGIVATPDEKTLIIDNTLGNALYLVDPSTGHATTIDVSGDAELGDGLILVGHTLYMVQGPFNRVAVIALSPDFRTGTVQTTLTNPALNFPSAIGFFGDALYAVNARFDVTPSPSVDYQIVRVSR